MSYIKAQSEISEVLYISEFCIIINWFYINASTRLFFFFCIKRWFKKKKRKEKKIVLTSAHMVKSHVSTFYYFFFLTNHYICYSAKLPSVGQRSLSFEVILQSDGFKRPCHKSDSLCWKAIILFNSFLLIVILVLRRAVLKNISLLQSSKSYSQEKPFTVLFLAYCEKMLSMSTLPLRS